MDPALRAALLAIDPATQFAGNETRRLVAWVTGYLGKFSPHYEICGETSYAIVERGRGPGCPLMWNHPKLGEVDLYACPAVDTELSAAMSALIKYAGDWAIECNDSGISVCLHKRGSWWGGEGQCDATTMAICRAILSAAKAEAESIPSAAGKVS